MQFECTSCKHIGYFSGMQKDDFPLCPVCRKPMTYFDKDKYLQKYVDMQMHESMMKNINYYGVEETFNMIDKTYHNATTRARIRLKFFETLKKLKLKWR